MAAAAWLQSHSCGSMASTLQASAIALHARLEGHSCMDTLVSLFDSGGSNVVQALRTAVVQVPHTCFGL